MGRLRKLRARIWHPPGASQSFCHHHTRSAPVHYTTPRTICSATRERLLFSATSSSKAGARPPSHASRRSSLPAFLTLVPSRLLLTPVPSLVQLSFSSSYNFIAYSPASSLYLHKPTKKRSTRELDAHNLKKPYCLVIVPACTQSNHPQERMLDVGQRTVANSS